MESRSNDERRGRMNKSDSIKEIAAALLEVQKSMPSVGKSATNPFFSSKYAPLEKVMPAALKALSDEDIAVSQFVSNIDGQSALTTLLMHTSGEWLSADQPLLLPKSDPQGQGSAITYARRYGLMSAIGMVADKDDDAEKARGADWKLPVDNKLLEAKQRVYKAFKDRNVEDTATMRNAIETAVGHPEIETVEDAELVIADLEAGDVSA